MNNDYEKKSAKFKRNFNHAIKDKYLFIHHDDTYDRDGQECQGHNLSRMSCMCVFIEICNVMHFYFYF